MHCATLRRLPRLSLHISTRPLASQAAGPSGVGPACFGSGLTGGLMGGLIGLGGGVVMVSLRPLTLCTVRNFCTLSPSGFAPLCPRAFSLHFSHPLHSRIPTRHRPPTTDH